MLQACNKDCTWCNSCDASASLITSPSTGQAQACTRAGGCRSVAWVLNGWFLFLPTGHTNLDYLMASITAGGSLSTPSSTGRSHTPEDARLQCGWTEIEIAFTRD
jgi:hypothetical protein